MIATYTQSCPRCAMPIIRGKTTITPHAGQWVHVDCETMPTPEQYPPRVEPTPPPIGPIPLLYTVHMSDELGLFRHAAYPGERLTICGLTVDGLTLGVGPTHTSWCGRCYQTLGSVVAHAAQYGQGE